MADSFPDRADSFLDRYVASSAPMHLSALGWGSAAVLAYALVPAVYEFGLVSAALNLSAFLQGGVAVVLVVFKVTRLYDWVEGGEDIPWAHVAVYFVGTALLVAVALALGSASERGLIAAGPVVGLVCGAVAVGVVRWRSGRPPREGGAGE